MTEQAICELCGEPMPDGEEMFKFHGYSGPCPKPPLPKEPARGYSYPRAPGIGRVADNERALIIYFDRKPTDDEMRDVHSVVRLYETELFRRDGTPNGGV